MEQVLADRQLALDSGALLFYCSTALLLYCRFAAIGVTGFEPATSSTRTTRSTKLSYTPRQRS